MSKKENKNINEVSKKEETALERIEPKLEEKDSYKKASLGEKISLKFRKRLIANRIYTLVLVAIIIAIVWGVNAWADSKKLAQIDVTQNHLFSITQTTKDQLKNLDKDILVYVYGITKDDDLVQFLQQYNAFNDKIKYEIITESTNYEAVTKYNLGNSKALVVTCGDKDRTIYPDYEFTDYDYNTGDSIDIKEEVITNAILKVSTDDPIKVYFATGNGEYSTNELAGLNAYLQKEVYETDNLNMLTITEIPEDCDILAIMSPEEDFSESQAELIKNYANNGGKLLICAILPNDKDFTNLQSVLDLYGAKIEKGILYEGNANNLLAYQNSIPLPYALIPETSSGNPITSGIGKNSSQIIIMPWSQSITTTNVDNVTESTILTTSSKCYFITDYTRGISDELLKNLETNTYTIGSEYTKTIGDGENEKTSKLVLYANTSFFVDNFQDGNVQLATMSNPGNINLALNTFAELADEQDLIAIRKAENVTNFSTTEAQNKRVKLIIFGIPVVIIVVGLIVWKHRRNKR